MRRQVIAGNWKLNKAIAETRELCQSLLAALGGVATTGGPEMLVCPPYTSLFAARETLDGSGIGLGAQNVFWKSSGAYTGQISVPMLVDAGCSHVIVGHSEKIGRASCREGARAAVTVVR